MVEMILTRQHNSLFINIAQIPNYKGKGDRERGGWDKHSMLKNKLVLSYFIIVYYLLPAPSGNLQFQVLKFLTKNHKFLNAAHVYHH